MQILTFLIVWLLISTLLPGCAEVTQPRPAMHEVEDAQLATARRHPRNSWAMERTSRVFIRLLAVAPQVHGRTYPFLGFDWWLTETGKTAIENVWHPSPARDADLKPGDLILAVNNWPIHPWAADYQNSVQLAHDAFQGLFFAGRLGKEGAGSSRRGHYLLLPAEMLVSLMLDFQHLRMEARGPYISGPVKLLIQRDREQSQVTLYPQHLPAEYGLMIATTDRDINAYAAPGRIILSQRMVSFCLNDDELALVVGHELAHHVQGHLVRGAGHQVLGELLGEAVTAFTTLSPRQILQWRYSRVSPEIRNVAGRAVISVFSQDDEREADAYGLWYAYQAGYDLDKALAFWERLAAVKYHDPFARNYFLNNHPPPLERLARLKRIAKYFKAGRAAEVFLQSPDLNRKAPPE